jgi:transposase
MSCWRGGVRARPRRAPAAFDRETCKERNTIERCFNQARQFRSVATRYGKRGRIYQDTIDVAAIRMWLGGPVT